MKIAVITPYCREDDAVFRACLESVRAQTWKQCTHFLVADGFPNPIVGEGNNRHVVLPSAHGDNGNIGRCIGGMLARAEGFDGIAFLDADNWYREDHIERLVTLHVKTGAYVCTSNRTIHRLDGSLMQIEQPDESDGKRFVDTSCLCIFRGAFDLLPLWGTMPPGTGPICDRIMWQAIIDRKTPRAHSPEPTVSFRTQYVYHYQVLGEELPPGAKQSKDVAVAAQTFHRLPLTTRVALLEGMPGGEEFVRPGRAQKSGGKTLTLDLTAGSRELAITLPDDSGIRAVVDEIINKKIYTPPAGIGAPRSILDIGANVGIAAAYFRAVYPDAVIHCVEPDPVAYDFLVNNARKIGNCLTYHAGLYNATCLRPFYFGESSVHNSIAAIPGQPTRLLCIDAKNFVSSLSVAKFDLIKIDTEGAELPIMWSLRDVLEQTPVIHLEYHSHRDRRLMDEMLTTSHYLSHGTVDSAHRGQLTYILHDLSRSPAMHEPLS